MGQLTESLNNAFMHMNVTDQDEPAMELSRIYAIQIENTTDSEIVRKLGAELTKLLVELLMTPKARAAIENKVKEAASDDDPESAASIFAKLRANAGRNSRVTNS